jgi:hypothetical protein
MRWDGKDEGNQGTPSRREMSYGGQRTLLMLGARKLQFDHDHACPHLRARMPRHAYMHAHTHTHTRTHTHTHAHAHAHAHANFGTL